MNSSKTIKKVMNIVTWVLIGFVLVVAILLAGVRLFGFNVYSVRTSSMEPDRPVGSLVYVKSVPFDEIQKGDDITFMLNEETIATHRVLTVSSKMEEVLDKNGKPVLDGNGDPVTELVYRYTTYGINGNQVDTNPVHMNNVLGKVHFSIPLLGYLAEFIKGPPGLYVAIAFGVVLLLLVFLPDIIFPPEKDKAVAAATEGGKNVAEKAETAAEKAEATAEEKKEEELPPADEAGE